MATQFKCTLYNHRYTHIYIYIYIFLVVFVGHLCVAYFLVLFADISILSKLIIWLFVILISNIIYNFEAPWIQWSQCILSIEKMDIIIWFHDTICANPLARTWQTVTLYCQAISLSVAAAGTTDIRVSHFLKFAFVATTTSAAKSGSWCKWGHERIRRDLISFNHDCVALNACHSVIFWTWNLVFECILQ